MSVITLAFWRPLPLGDRVKECELQIKKTWSKTLGYATRRKRNLLRSTSKCSAQAVQAVQPVQPVQPVEPLSTTFV